MSGIPPIETFFGYAPPPVAPTPTPLNQDLVIAENNPGIQLVGSEVGAEQAELREIAGDLWVATNATYATGAWAPLTVSPCFATVYRANGNVDRLVAPGASPTPIAWTTVISTDASGAITSNPVAFLTAAELALGLAPIWNAPNITMTGIRLNVNDISSNAASLLLDLQVGGVSKFSVRKDGSILTAGAGVAAIQGSSALPVGGTVLQWGSTANIPADGSAIGACVFANPYPNAIFQVVPTVDPGVNLGVYELSVQVSSLTKIGFAVSVAGGPPGSTVTVRFFAVGN